jgi:hypothetical protein
MKTQITSDDLRAERTWLLQHGKQDLTEGRAIKRCFVASFKTENDFEKFSRWLRCFEADFQMQANAFIRFMRISGCYAKVTLAPSSRYDEVFHAISAFNGHTLTN